MIRLIASGQTDDTRYELDVEGSVEISFNGKPIEAVGKNAGSFSSQFKMPFSKGNNKFFEYFYDVNVDQDKFNHSITVDVEVYDDHYLVFVGQLQLLSVNVFTKKYEVLVIADSASLFSIVRGMSWRELFRDEGGFSPELDHALTASNVLTSWDTAQDITNGQVGAGTIVYALTDNAQTAYNPKRWHYNGESVNTIFEEGITQPNFIRANELRPAIKVKYLLAKIFQKAGFVWDSGFLQEDHVDKLYMLTATHMTQAAMRSSYGATANLSSSLTVLYTDTDYTQLVFSNEVFDPDNSIQSGSFIAPYDGIFQLKVITTGAGVAGDEFVIGAQINNSGPVYANPSIIPASTTAGVIDTFNFTLSEGDIVTFYIKIYSTANFVLSTQTRLEFSLYQSPNAVVDMVGCLPDCTVDEWLRAIAQTFNLVMIPKTNAPRTIIVETVEDYYAKALTTKDWTQKVDLDKDIILRPTTQEQSKRIIFTDKEGKDFQNGYWQYAFGKVKGRHVYENTNVHAEGEEKIGDFFAPLRMSNVGTFELHNATMLPDLFVINMWTIRNGEPQAQTGPPMLMYYQGTKPVGGTMYVGEYSVANYGLFTHLDAVTGTPRSLRWGHDWPDHNGHQYFPFTTRNLFNEYHAKHMMRVYDIDARTLFCHMYLTSTDILNLNLYDRVWVHNAYYRIVGIQNYAIGQPTASRVQLLKDLEVIKFNCVVVPDVFNNDGTIGFVDVKTGEYAEGNEECCSLFGYAWNSATNQCYWTSGVDTYIEPPVAPWGDSDDIDNVNPPYPFEEEQNDENTGLSTGGMDAVMFGHTNSNETITLNDTAGHPGLPVTKGPVFGGTIQIVGKNLITGNIVSELIAVNYDSEAQTLSAQSVQKLGSFGSVTIRSSSLIDGIEVQITGVNGEPCSWTARITATTFRTDYHNLPGVQDIHGSDALWDDASTIYIAYDPEANHALWNN